MEGSRSGAALAAALLAVWALGALGSGCGDDGPSAARGGAGSVHPERDFAPLVELARDEPWRPMSARWFIERSVLWFAEDDGCADRKVAVGRTLPAQHNAEIEWIFPIGIGKGPTYYRNAFDADCRLELDRTFYADQLTRPHDPGPRVEGIRPGEGFYMDLVDAARSGPAFAAGHVGAPIYAERTDEGDGGVRLSYWMLFGMSGAPEAPDAREGEWVRVDVVLRADGDRYEPIGVQALERGRSSDAASGGFDEVAWSEASRIDGTHPVVRLTRAGHEPVVQRRGAGCGGCVMWRTWRALADARAQLWYGFGGAWGAAGETSATTGALGPGRYRPSASEKERELAEREAADSAD